MAPRVAKSKKKAKRKTVAKAALHSSKALSGKKMAVKQKAKPADTAPALKKRAADIPSGPIKAPSVNKSRFPIVVFDTETTGLTKNRTVRLDKQPEINEFYGELVDLDSGEVLAEYDTLIRPVVEFPMTPYTIKETKTKLSNDLLKDAPTFADKSNEIKAFLEQGPGVLAHNLSFDKDMIEIELERLGGTIVWPMIQICTVEQTIHLRGRRMRLINLHEYLFGVDFESAHRARPDVKALTRVAVELRKRGVL